MYGHAAVFLVMAVCAVSSRTVRGNVAKGETPVTEFTGQTLVMNHLSAIVNMTWKIHPANATLFWIKVFHGNSTTTENQVFGYNFIKPNKTWAPPKFQGRLHHNVYHQDDANVFQLTITDPKYSDIGVYVAVLYGSGFDDQLEATLNLTYENVTQFLVSNQTSEKSKEVTEFTGLTSVMYNYVNLTWVIRPGNATLFGIMFFLGNSTGAENQIYHYSFTDLRTRISPEYRGRLAHKVYHTHNATVFQLILTNPKYSDIGVYVGVLNCSGFDKPLEATLNLTYENVTQSLVSNQTSEKSKEEAGSNITGLFIFLAIAVPIGLVGLFVIPIAVKKWKKQKRARIHKKKGEDFEETISLQKTGEDKGKSAVFFAWKRYLCYTSIPTGVNKSDDTGDKEDAV